MKKLFLTCALAALITPFAFAAESPWAGTWKLDPAKSHLTGETFTYSKEPNGMIRYTAGENVVTFAIDGKDYATQNDGRTTAWTAAGDNAWDSVAKFKGIPTFKAHRTLSADGKTYTIKGTSFLPDGTTNASELVYTRVSGTSGLAGTWRSSKVEDSSPDVYTISAKAGGVFRWYAPAYKETVEGKADGSDLVFQGPQEAANTTIAYKAVSPTSMSYTVKRNGKPIYYGTQTLAADGKSFMDTSWSAGKESEKTSGFYVKQ